MAAIMMRGRGAEGRGGVFFDVLTAWRISGLTVLRQWLCWCWGGERDGLIGFLVVVGGSIDGSIEGYGSAGDGK